MLFKAEVGAATSAACQIQGVWVAPALRGQGLGTAGTAAVAAAAQRDIAPVVSLYVNAFNARRAAGVRPGRLHPPGDLRQRPVLDALTCHDRSPKG